MEQPISCREYSFFAADYKFSIQRFPAFVFVQSAIPTAIIATPVIVNNIASIIISFLEF